MDIKYRTPDGEDIAEYAAIEIYRDMLDDVYGDVTVAGTTYTTSRALEVLDPIAFMVGFSDWTDAEGFEEV